jgi:hypothetical protein
MANNGRLEQLRNAVLGNNRRGREVEVNPDGQVVLDPENASNNSQDQETEKPKTPKMSPHTWALV